MDASEQQVNQPASLGRKTKTPVAALVALLVLVLVAFAWWFMFRGARQAKAPTSNYMNPTATSSASNSVTPGGTSKTYPVKVYFSKHPDSDSDPTKVFAVSRTSTDAGVAKFSLSELIAGPTAAEKTQGYYTQLTVSGSSSCAGDSFTISIVSGKATVKFCKETSLGGELDSARLQAEIETTIQQFSTITKVVVLNKNGDCMFDLSGMNMCLSN